MPGDAGLHRHHRPSRRRTPHPRRTGALHGWTKARRRRVPLRAQGWHGVLAGLSSAPITDSQGAFTGFRTSSRDITDRKQIEAELRISAVAFDSREGMLITDANSKILRVNKAFTEITGYTAEEIVGKHPNLLRSDRHGPAFFQEMRERPPLRQMAGRNLGPPQERRGLSRMADHLGRQEQGQPGHPLRQHASRHQRPQAGRGAHPRTGLLRCPDPPAQPHPAAGPAQAGHRPVAAHRDLRRPAVHRPGPLQDLERHRRPRKGDTLLKQVAQRLVANVRENDTVARVGGDEFVVVLEGLNEHQQEAATQTRAIGEKILAALGATYQLDDVEYRTTASIGATVFLGRAASVDELMKQADLAMYKAKETGRNALRFFDPAMQTAVLERATLEAGLRKAIDGDQLLLHYQPQVVEGGRVTGAEVLVRWQHPQRGMVPPGDFIPWPKKPD
jgi:PAS domain-containing protein